MNSIAIYGGSFNPPHLGHVSAAKTAMEALNADRFFFVPDYEPPHKELCENSPSAECRYRLTQLAAAELPKSETLDLELRREGKSYTSDTLEALKQQYPDSRLCFLMGTDMFLTLDSWHEPEKVMALAQIGVFVRGSGQLAAIEEKKKELEKSFGADVVIIRHEPLDISSSELRELLPQRKGREYLPDGVYEEIIRLRLYGAKPEFAWLREKAYACLKPKRIPHVAGTEQEAIKLARFWGENEDDAAEAAILHDITKKLSHEEQLQMCASYGIITDNLEKNNEKLLHSRTGAVYAKAHFGVPAHIEAAIRWHTTGRADMTKLEKIIYLADYIEPTRSGFDGLEELRRTAYEDLDAAMAMALGMSYAEVTEKGVPFHPNSANAKTYYEALCRDKGLF